MVPDRGRVIPPPSSPSRKGRAAWETWRLVAKEIPQLRNVGGGFKIFFTNALGQWDCLSYRGITRWLSRNYWPHYNHTRAQRASTGSPHARIVNPPRHTPAPHVLIGGPSGRPSSMLVNRNGTGRPVKKPRCANRYVAGLLGRERGRCIHNQLAAHIASASEPNAINTLHSGARAVLRYVRESNWIFVGANLPVCDPRQRYNRWATEIDLVAIDPANDALVLIELKTGYDNGVFTAASGTMADATLKMSDSPVNQAKIQLIASVMLYETCYPSAYTKGFRLCILHVDSTGDVSEYRITKPEYQRIYNALRMRWWTHRIQRKQPKRPRPPRQVSRGARGSLPYVNEGEEGEEEDRDYEEDRDSYESDDSDGYD